MTNPNPNPPPRDERQDELIAGVVAFAAIGTILFLGLGRLGGNQIFSAQPLSDAERSRRAGDALFGFDLDDDEALPEAEGRIAAGVLESDDAVGLEDRSLAEERRLERGTNILEQDSPPRVNRADSPIVIAPAPRVEGTAPVPSAGVTGENLSELPATDESAEELFESPVDEEAGAAPEAGAEELIDVAADYWAVPFINRLDEENIIAGFNDGTFRPEQPVTRAEFAALLTQAFVEQSADETVPYGDVTADYWAADPISRVSQADFMSGYPDGDFLPGELVSRLEVLVSLVSGLGLDAPESPEEILSTYTDQDQILEWAVPQIAAATQNELAVNHPNPEALNPQQPATRAETAAMIHQALVQQGRLEPIDSEYIVQSE
ncbi:MAG: S-layer homology domain-containing protein [Elainellaceae cyanobacterium]